MAFICLTLLIPLLLTISGEAGNRRVIDRFPNSKLPTPTRCLIGILGMADVAAQFDTAANRRMVEEEGKGMIRALTRMNCSLIRLSTTSTGHLNANGSYDGLAGHVQRNEIDFPLFFFRTDFFPITVSYMSTQGLAADVVIVSRKIAPYKENYSIMELWRSSFDLITVVYVLISVFLFLTVLTLTETIPFLYSDESLLKKIVKQTHVNIFKVLFSFVDQENFDASSNSGRIIVWFFNLFLLFFVHGFVFGSMGADLVALIDPPVINSMYEFSNTSETQPVIIKQLYLTPLLERSRPGTELGHLTSVLKSKNDSNIFSLDISQNFMMLQRSISVLLDEVMKSFKALVIADLTMTVGIPTLCELQPDLASKLRRSRKMFFPGILTSIMSLKIDPHLRQFWNYVLGTICETGRMTADMAYTTRKSMVMMGLTYTGKSCETVPEKDQIISPFDWLTFEPIFRTYAILMLASAVVLLIEKHDFMLRVSRSSLRGVGFVVLFTIMICMRVAVGATRLCKKLTRKLTRSD